MNGHCGARGGAVVHMQAEKIRVKPLSGVFGPGGYNNRRDAGRRLPARRFYI